MPNHSTRLAVAVLALAFSACASDCSETLAKARAGIETAVAARNACKSAADCVVVFPSLSCYGTCGHGIAASRKADFDAEMARLDDEVCSGAQCAVMPSCVAVQATCTTGRCQVGPFP